MLPGWGARLARDSRSLNVGLSGGGPARGADPGAARAPRRRSTSGSASAVSTSAAASVSLAARRSAPAVSGSDAPRRSSALLLEIVGQVLDPPPVAARAANASDRGASAPRELPSAAVAAAPPMRSLAEGTGRIVPRAVDGTGAKSSWRALGVLRNGEQRPKVRTTRLGARADAGQHGLVTRSSCWARGSVTSRSSTRVADRALSPPAPRRLRRWAARSSTASPAGSRPCWPAATGRC